MQNGYALSGAIEVSETAADDGLLAVEKILDWSWVADGPTPYSGQFRPASLINPMPLRATGLEIDSDGIYVPATSGATLILEDAFIGDFGLVEARRLLWGRSENFAFYVLTGLEQGDIGFTAWEQTIPSDSIGSRWLIATPLPEPSSVWLAIAVICGVFSRLGLADRG